MHSMSFMVNLPPQAKSTLEFMKTMETEMGFPFPCALPIPLTTNKINAFVSFKVFKDKPVLKSGAKKSTVFSYV